MRSVLLILCVILAAAGCCKDCVRSKPAGPKVEEYPVPPPPPQ